MNEPILYNFFDKAYNTAASVMPKSFQEHPEILAAGFGAVGGYILTRGIQFGIKKISPKVYNKYLPKIEVGLGLIVSISPMIYNILNSQSDNALNDIYNAHPVYTSGVMFGVIGSITAGVQDATISRKDLSLVDRINEDKPIKK